MNPQRNHHSGRQYMFFRWIRFKSFGLFSFILLGLIAGAIQPGTPIRAQGEIPRDIISDDFLKNRPAKPRSSKNLKKPSSTYRLATTPTKQFDQSRLQVGLTIWKLEPVTAGSSSGGESVYGADRNKLEWTPRRVEADAKFSEGDSLRLSIESPRAGYLYVVNRDWLADGSFGETNLIFPTEGEDNRLEAGKLIDIPGQGEVPFRATPKPNQSGELLTFIVTSSPLPLRLSKRPLPISKTQLTGWEEKWGAEVDRFEMNGGVGQARTKEEQLAASPTGTRQLTREDPLPQTIYSLVPKNSNALLFNIVLAYVR
jgi:hypothetical protein